MTFCEAIESVKRGNYIGNESWIHKNVFMYWDKKWNEIMLEWDDGRQTTYDPTQKDVLSNDFYIKIRD